MSVPPEKVVAGGGSAVVVGANLTTKPTAAPFALATFQPRPTLAALVGHLIAQTGWVTNPQQRTPRAWSILGAILGALGYIASLTPTLLPRTTLSQALTSAIVVITMYAIGAVVEGVIGAVVRQIRQPASLPARSWSWPLIVVTVALIIVAAAFTPSRMQWQAEQAAIVGATTDPSWPLVIVVTLLLTLILLYLGRGVRHFTRWLGRIIASRWTQNQTVLGYVGGVAAAIVITAVVVLGYSASMVMFNSVNDSTVAGATEPTAPTRSGSPESLISWASLGQQGRQFVSQGPEPEAIKSVTGQQPKAPIRIFAGVESAAGLQAQANLALADLKRSGGFERSHIILYTPSDNGTVDANAAAAAEYLTSGDVASVAMQYTVLPSFLSYALSQGTSQDAGTILFNTIHNAIQELPDDARPKLYVYGESLGAFGSQAPFDGEGIPGLVDKVDGALWVGPPSTSTFWNQLNQEATGGTPWQPVVAGGTVVRFAADVAAVTATDTEWGPVRALYLQNSTDPVVWWPGSVLTEKPAWLDGQRGPGVPEQMTWLPLITFEQMLLDMPFAMSGPQGVGHNYFDAVGPAWTEILMPPDWTPAKAAALHKALGAS